MITAVEFLAVLEEKDLLPKDLLFDLYKRVAQAQSQMTTDEISRILIEQGYLTQVLADRLTGADKEQPARNAGDSSIFKSQDLEKYKKHESSGVHEIKSDEVEDIGFLPLKEEREPRPVIGRHKAYKPGDSSKNLAGGQSASSASKPTAPPPPKPTPLEKPQSTRWASSMYDRDIDTSKGIVSPRLVQLAGIEKIPEKLVSPRKTRWMKVLIRFSIILGFSVLLYLLIDWIFFKR